jgi:hypothetical protein
MHALLTEIRRIGGDPADDVWQWFVTRGPHGSEFTWGQTRSSPPGYVGLTHLEDIVAREEKARPGFSTRARSVALAALGSSHPDLVRRGLQVLGVVGTGTDLESVKPLAGSQDPQVAADAKACIFQLKRAA